MSSRTIHPFPARMAPDIAISTIARQRPDAPLRILDPMCGSGTVLSAAAAQGHTALGFDLDPLAVLMSNVAVRPLNGEDLNRASATAVAHAYKAEDCAPPWDDDETDSFARYWFDEAQLQTLSRLSCAIRSADNGPTREAMYVALSRIIVTKMPKASLAADTSHSRPHRVMTVSSYDVLAGFEHSSKTLSKLLGERCLTGHAAASLGDSRALAMRDSTIDLVVTSPPYLNAIDYLRGHRLALIWLGHTIPALRAVRSHSIGAERAPDGEIGTDATALVDAIHRLVEHPDRFPRRIVERYALDLALFARQIYRVCAPNAQVVVVVGNSTLKGNFIRNDLLVSKALKFAGFNVTNSRSRDLPESHRYLPVSSRHDRPSSLSKRMRTEIVITARKVGQG